MIILSNMPNKINLTNKINDYYHQSNKSMTSCIQLVYNNIVNQFNLDSVFCPCHDDNDHPVSDWAFHAYYERYICIHGKKYKIIITRVICNHCGKTHAILIEDMVPFFSLCFDTIKQLLSNHSTYFAFYYIRHKFKDFSTLDFQSFCTSNSRKLPCIFVST